MINKWLIITVLLWVSPGMAGENLPFSISWCGVAGSLLHSGPLETATVGVYSLRQIDVSLLFHFNQNLVPYGKVANLACYVGLLETLRAHPQSKFCIHISGTLIHDLLWFDDRAIQLIREGVEDGQFEILGSTYSQNVMYSTAAWDNDQEIKTHRALIEKTFGVIPTGFWNPERCWKRDFVPLLADNGYLHTQVEDHILYDSGITTPENRVRITQNEGKQLYIVDDDKEFEAQVNGAINSGSAAGVISYLWNLYQQDSTDDFLVAYFEDAEASGLWQYEGGTDPQEIWDNLDTVLTQLENNDWINLTTIQDFIDNNQISEEITPIVDGQASWMIGPAQQMGYEDWFDFNLHHPALNYFRGLFALVRDSIISVQDQISVSGGDTTAASKLCHQAIRTFVSHQYEFGCVGNWSIQDGNLNLIRDVLVPLYAAKRALNPVTEICRTDLNLDSISEVVIAAPKDLWILSPYGGRLLYWFDLEGGEELVGNENFVYYGEDYTNDSKYLPELRGGQDIYTWLSDNYIFPEIFQWRFQIRRRALNDWVLVNGTSMGELVHQPYIVNLHDEEVEFVYSGDQISLTKALAPGEDGLDVRYLFQNKSGGLLSIDLSVESGFCPSYAELMDGGRDCLRYWDGEDTTYQVTSSTIGVKNMETGTTVFYLFDSQPTYLRGEENVFGLELNPGYQFTVPPDSSHEVDFSLMDSTTPTAVKESRNG